MGHKMMDNEKERTERKREDKKRSGHAMASAGIPNGILDDILESQSTLFK